MTFNGWLQIAIFSAIVIALARPFGGYMTRVFQGERTLLSPVPRPVERGIYAICGVRETEEQNWVTYTIAMLAFSVAGFVSLYALQRLQNVLRFNPQKLDPVGTDLAFNTSVSFMPRAPHEWQDLGGLAQRIVRLQQFAEFIELGAKRA